MVTNRKGYMRAYYQAHKEKMRDYQRAYYEKHKDEQNARHKEYYKTHRDSIKEKNKVKAQANPRLFDMREDYATPTREDFQSIPKETRTKSQIYYAENREKVKAYQRTYREKKKKREKQRAYYEANKERIAAQQREYHSKKAKEKRMSKTFLGRITLKVKKFFS